MVFVSVLIGFVGARAFHILGNAAQFMADPMSMIFSRAGFSIYGGLIVGIAPALMPGYPKR